MHSGFEPKSFWSGQNRQDNKRDGDEQNKKGRIAPALELFT